MTSAAKKAANLKNCKLSTGPKTPKGKAASRRNSYKHGLAGNGLVLDAAGQARLDKLQRAYLLEFAPRNQLEEGLVLRLAVANVQMDAATARIFLDQADNVRDAFRRWDFDREAQVEALIACMEEDPKEVVHKLQRTTHGCQWMLDRWGELMETLGDSGGWSDAEYLLVHRMTGLSLAHLQHEDADHVAILDAEVERLEALDEQLWQDFDGPHYAGAEARACWDDSPHGELMRRYEKAAERLFFRTLSEIRASRKEPLGRLGVVRPAAVGLGASGLSRPASVTVVPSPQRNEAKPASAPRANEPKPAVAAPQRNEAKPAPAPVRGVVERASTVPQRNEAKPKISVASAVFITSKNEMPAAASPLSAPSGPLNETNPRPADRRRRPDPAKAIRAAKSARKRKRREARR